MKYIGDLCDYSTDRKYDYTKHLISKKHKKKVQVNTNNLENVVISLANNSQIPHNRNNKSYVCKYCSKPFHRTDNLNRHYKTCVYRLDAESELKKTISETQQKLKEKDTQYEKLMTEKK